jgi:hypothetical protein
LCAIRRFPIIIHWGWPDLVVLYNDAFIQVIGDKHPNALGTRLFDSWPELLPTIEGMLETVLTAGKATLAENLLHVYDRSWITWRSDISPFPSTPSSLIPENRWFFHLHSQLYRKSDH